MIQAPFVEVAATQDRMIHYSENIDTEILVHCTYYTVEKIDIHGEVRCKQDKPFLICSVIDGEGYIDDQFISKGTHFIIPSGYGTYQWKGNLSLICSYI